MPKTRKSLVTQAQKELNEVDEKKVLDFYKGKLKAIKEKNGEILEARKDLRKKVEKIEDGIIEEQKLLNLSPEKVLEKLKKDSGSYYYVGIDWCVKPTTKFITLV